jgi:hypothetical protein
MLSVMVNHISQRLRIAVLVSAVAGALALAAEVTTGAARARKSESTPTTSLVSALAPAAQGAPRVTRVALGHTVRLRADATRLAVTVSGVRTSLSGNRSDIALHGWRYIGVLVDVTDIGTGAYSSSDWADVSLYASDGSPAWHAVLGNATCATEGQPNALAAGDSRRSCVPFELPAHLRPGEITFAPDGGFGMDIGEWTVPSVHTERGSR